MGCCCSDPGVAGVPNDVPAPPPLCQLRTLTGTIARYGTGYAQGPGKATHHELLLANDAAWDEFSSPSWIQSSPPNCGFNALDPTSPLPFSLVTGPALFNAGFRLSDNPTFFFRSNASAIYVEQRQWILLPLIHEFGGTIFSLRQLYGVSALVLDVVGSLFGTGVFHGFLDGIPFIWNYAGQAWSTWDILWGKLDAADLQTGLFPWSEVTRPTDATIANGLADIATNTLASGVSVANTNVAAGAAASSANEIDISSLVDETGGEYLLILVKVPAGTPAKHTPTIGPQFQRYVFEVSGPKPIHGNTFNVGPSIEDYMLVEIWGCILSMTIRIDIEQASSTIAEEDRTDTAGFLSGTGQGKTFRLQDNSASGATALSERLFLAVESNSLWAQPEPDDLDNTTVFPANPTSIAPVFFDANDDSEAQIWDLTAPALGHGAGTITATLFLFGTNQDTGGSLQASLKVGGVFQADQTIDLDLGEAGWKSVELASGLSVADFSGAQLRLTTGAATGTESFPAIYVLLESTGSVNVTRRCDVFLSEDGGDTFLNFDYHRASDPGDADYYIEPDPPFQVQVGAGTSYETLADLIGAEHTFNHDGDDNADTGQGTVDATVKITVEHISVSNALP